MDKLDTVLGPALAVPDAAALDVMRLSLADWLAVGLAGTAEPVARITRDLAISEAGAGQATLFGGGRVPARAAALVNGATSHALDYDDTHFAHIGHPSVAVIPAALALCEVQSCDLLRAALAGCEASVRFGLAFGRAHYQTGFHQTATAGAFGATVAAGQVLGLSQDRMRHALGLAATRASGLKAQFGTMGKPYNAGIAASNGVECALLAARGMESNPEAVFGPLGFCDTHHCDGQVSENTGFLMTQVSHKFHACCHGLHATLEALELLKPVDPAQIRRIEIATHPRWMSVCNQPSPTTGLGAKFSYRMVTALSLSGHSTAALDSYSDALCADPALIALRDKVHVTAQDGLSETAANVRIDGAEARFDLAAPLSLAQRTDKMRTKIAALMGGQADAVWQAGQSGDVAAITALMR